MLDSIMLLVIVILSVATLKALFGFLSWASEDPLERPEVKKIAEWANYESKSKS